MTDAQRGAIVEVRALISSPVGAAVFEPALFVRLPGLPRFTRLALQPKPAVKDLSAAVIPAELVTGDFDYSLEAFDSEGNGPGRAGSPERPLRVKVSAPVPEPAGDRPVQILLSTPPPEPASEPIVEPAPPAGVSRVTEPAEPAPPEPRPFSTPCPLRERSPTASAQGG